MDPLPPPANDDPGLDETSLPPTPLHLALRWMREAIAREQQHADIIEPAAMCLATVDGDGHPRSRMVLMRFLDGNGPGFLTAAESRKADDIAHQGWVSATMTWLPMMRAIHFRGPVTPIDAASLEEFWTTRPHSAQLTMMASEQSQPIGSREELVMRADGVSVQHGPDDALPRPDKFVGWQISCREVEFWSGRADRLHDRLQFTNPSDLTLGDPGWQVTRLMP